MARPLDGIRILDNGIVQAGTFPSRLLADFGAEVVRVENYANPDISRNIAFADGVAGDPFWESGGTYHEQHRNKAFCIGLDVRVPDGRDAFLRLVKVSDIVLDSHPPGVMDRLGLDYEALKEARPDIISVSTSGYGYGGPFSTMRSYGMMTETMCGLVSLNGYEGEPPRRGACPLTDHPSTYHIAFVMVAALVRRTRTGEGIWIDVSQYEVGVNLLGDAFVANAIGAPIPERSGHADTGSAFSGVFKCAGYERWVAVSATTPARWRSLCTLLDRNDLVSCETFDREQTASACESLASSLAQWCVDREAGAVAEALSAAGVAASTVTDARDLLLDYHLKDRGFFWLVDHAPEQHAGLRAWPGPPARLSATPAELRYRAPMLGEHNRLVATTLLGYSRDEYEQLEASGAFGKLPAAASVKFPPMDVPARVHLSPAAFGRSKLYDPGFLSRLRSHFGPQYGVAGDEGREPAAATRGASPALERADILPEQETARARRSAPGGGGATN